MERFLVRSARPFMRRSSDAGVRPGGRRGSSMVTAAPGARRIWPSVTTRSPAFTPSLRYAVWPTMRSTVTMRGATLLSAPITQVIMPCCAGSTAVAGTASMRGLTSTVSATSTDSPGHSTSSAFSA